jgi:DNA-binding winged helix-turn-helix (wHTH) protein/predicted ATPase/class 3 adenylate cyclase
MRYVFADCILDTRLYTLHREGTTVRLRPKVFHVLQYLLEHRDHVISKDELCTQVWPGQFISDATLEGCITLARRAIGDSGRAQQLIQSRRGYGYRFVGAVQAYAAGPSGQEAVAAAQGPPAALSQAPAPALPAPTALSGPPEVLDAGAATRRLVLPPPPGASLQRPLIQDVPEGERKLVTFLSCTLGSAVGGQASADREALAHLRRTLFTLAQQEVLQYGGAIQQVAGDHLLAVFGAPLAQEDHAQRAVLAALELRQRLSEPPIASSDPVPVPLAACLRLHTALTIVGALEEAPEVAKAVIGETSGVLAALQMPAVPGTVVCSEATASWIKGMVRLQAVRPGPGCDPDTLPKVYTVLGMRSRRVPGVWRARQRRGPFVGRTHELATLHRLLAQAEAGRGQMVGIVGAPGLGKSRLLREFRHRLRGRRLTYLRGRCLSYGQATPYLPVLTLLRHAWGITPADRSQGIATKVRRGLHEVGMASEEAVALLLALLGVEEDPAPLAALPPEVRKARTFATLVQLCLHGSQQRPLILEIEDLHWSDATSEAWLADFGACLGTAPILVLGTYRPGYRPAWLDISYATQLPLPPLSPQASRRLVRARVPGVLESQALLGTIVTKAAGNPFFLEELARTVGEQEAWRLPLQVPETVQAVLAARLDRLPPDAKRLLQVAAVCGSEVDFPLLHAVVAQPEEAMQRHLAALQAAELLTPLQLFPAPLYAFQHVLIQEVAYQSLLVLTRQQLHRQVAEVLTTRFPEMVAAQPERVAQHYTEAGLHALAVPYWQRAGERASQRSAYVEAVSHLSKGLELLRALPDTPARAQSELRLLTRLRLALAVTKGYAAPELTEVHARMRALCQQVEEPTILLGALGGLWTFYLARAEVYTAYELAEESLTLAQRVRRPGAAIWSRAPVSPRRPFLWGHVMLGQTLLVLGEFSRAREHAELGMAVYEPHLHRPQVALVQQDPGVMCLVNAAQALWHLGYPEQALQQSHAALALARELEHPYSLGWALSWAAILHWHRHESQATLAQLDAAAALATEHGFVQWAAQGTILRGRVLATQGHAGEGMAQIQQGLAAYRTTGSALLQPYFLALLAEAYRHAGQAEAGLAVVTDALRLVDDTGERWYQAELYRLKGELLLDLSAERQADAALCIQQALDIARQQQAKSLELRAVMRLARLWQQQGRVDAARQLLTESYGWFTEGFATADLQEAHRLLQANGVGLHGAPVPHA